MWKGDTVLVSRPIYNLLAAHLAEVIPRPVHNTPYFGAAAACWRWSKVSLSAGQSQQVDATIDPSARCSSPVVLEYYQEPVGHGTWQLRGFRRLLVQRYSPHQQRADSLLRNSISTS